jgi:hypothetical protein
LFTALAVFAVGCDSASTNTDGAVDQSVQDLVGSDLTAADLAGTDLAAQVDLASTDLACGVSTCVGACCGGMACTATHACGASCGIAGATCS